MRKARIALARRLAINIHEVTARRGAQEWPWM